ncbi:hypothetical protein T11_4707 [Trichinella zimbabwensis]|uniref:Uncharacterized protein n=1 Tax=Trichinella zimbabwensis TaxID=268475 RepID=A0A0V1GPB1_9BILA|nr:hypothetical protein T11_14539 [Trichinella zimbabwensis]KRY99912.1 hypothetical protein T11_4707 [Trichinella zimbabwensis]
MQEKCDTSEDSVTLMENMYLTAGSFIHEAMTAVTEQLTGDNVQSLRETRNLTTDTEYRGTEADQYCQVPLVS